MNKRKELQGRLQVLKRQDNVDNSFGGILAIYSKAFIKISVTFLLPKFSQTEIQIPYLVHTDTEDTILQTDILFYLLHITD